MTAGAPNRPASLDASVERSWETSTKALLTTRFASCPITTRKGRRP